MNFEKLTIVESDSELSNFARALAIPVRIAIIRILIINGTWVAPDVFAELQLGTVTIDRHLKAMVLLKIIKEKHYNRKIYYSINEAIFIKISNEFMALFNFFKTSCVKPE
ncbi:ArsR family transcriptional regulator [Mucilaginibacter paludis]|uniref:ArsR family transcriptional regulator n=1 Tax=Mucilaginibacter paludis DSM 18603 TaxID=714943 RepID=H1YIF1_9SPHI|nr:ArsR family transcriptional regulator [Mucilaginibacter paludis]EHQ27564.1 ArsR family transcriptional regulator [Mucilaginibacter paludis DSM 18603]